MAQLSGCHTAPAAISMVPCYPGDKDEEPISCRSLARMATKLGVLNEFFFFFLPAAFSIHNGCICMSVYGRLRSTCTCVLKSLLVGKRSGQEWFVPVWLLKEGDWKRVRGVELRLHHARACLGNPLP